MNINYRKSRSYYRNLALYILWPDRELTDRQIWEEFQSYYVYRHADPVRPLRVALGRFSHSPGYSIRTPKTFKQIKNEGPARYSLLEEFRVPEIFLDVGDWLKNKIMDESVRVNFERNLKARVETLGIKIHVKHPSTLPSLADISPTRRFPQIPDLPDSAKSERNPSLKIILNVLEKKKQLILAGPPGTGKSFVVRHIFDKWPADSRFVFQLHPSISYREFVGGLIPVPKNGGTGLKWKKGLIWDPIEKARGTNSSSKKGDGNGFPTLVVLEEINRTNLSNVFGELISLLDRTGGFEEIRLTGSEEKNVITLPEKLYIVGTMNNADRTIAFMDKAIARRFSQLRFWPDAKILEPISVYTGSEMDLISGEVARLLEIINERLERVTGDPTKVVGHTFFLPPEFPEVIEYPPDQFMLNWYSNVLPYIEELVGHIPENLKKVISQSELRNIKPDYFRPDGTAETFWKAILRLLEEDSTEEYTD